MAEPSAPVPGRSNLHKQAGIKHSNTPVPSRHAAPGDGRTPETVSECDQRNLLHTPPIDNFKVSKAGTIKKIADELIAAKGVKHGKLTVTSTGKDLPG
jgi:hypothetical protein